MADLVTRLLLNSSQFDNNIRQSTQQVQQFQQIGRNITATIGRFAGALGIAMTAGEAFKKTIASSQTTADEYDKIMRSVTNTVDNFFTSLSTGDFTFFNQGLTDIISKARETQAALDQLGNTTMSYSYFSAINNADFAAALQTAKDKTKNEASRNEAKRTAESIIGKQSEITDELVKTVNQAIANMVTESTSLSATNFERIDLNDILYLDVSSGGSEKKALLEKQYKEYTKLYSQIRQKYSTTETVGFGMNVHTVTSYNESEIKKAMQPVNEQYKQAILYNEILVRKSDDWLQNLIDTAIKADNATRSLAAMKQQMNEINNQSVTSKKVIPAAGSIAELENKIAGLKLQFKKTTDEGMRAGVMLAIKEAETQLKIMQLKASKMDLLKASKIDPLAKKQQNSMPLTNVNTKDLDKFRTITLIDTDTSALDYMNTMATLVGNISGATNNATASWLQYSANIISSIGAMLPAMASLFGITAALGVAEQSKLVFPLNLIAMAATTAGLIAAIASIPKFADGGIFTGNSTVGDMNLARVNAGEMILNNRQQRNLFNLLNGNGSSTNGNTEVKLRIEGRDLVGVLNNQMRKTSKYV